MIGRVRVAGRLAAGNLRQAKLSTALAVLLIAVPFAAVTLLAPGVTSYGAPGPFALGPGLVVEAVLVVLVLVVLRSVLAVRERARARTGALLVVNGARASDLRWAQGGEVWALGTAGALLGGVLPVVALRLFAGYQIGVDPRAVAAIVIGAPVLAAVATLPGSSRSVTTGFRSALAGSRPSPPLRARTPIIGAVLLAAGAGAVLAASSPPASFSGARLLAGLVLGVAGVACIAVALLALAEPATDRLGLPARIAGRTLARQRHRTGPILVVLVVLLSAAVVVATGSRSIADAKTGRAEALGRFDVRTIPEDTVLLAGSAAGFGDQATVPESARSTVQDLLPQASIVPIETFGWEHPVTITSWDPRTGAFGTAEVGVATPELVHALGLEAHQPDLDAGRVLVLDPLAATSSGDGVPASITIRDDLTSGSLNHEAVVVWPERIMTHLPAALVPPQAVGARVDRRQGSLLVHQGAPIEDSLRAELLARAQPGIEPGEQERLGLTTSSGAADHVFWDQGRGTTLVLPAAADREVVAASSADPILPVTVYPSQVEAFLIAGLVAVAVGVAAAVALSARQRRSDDELLVVQGAQPSLRGRVGAWEAGILAMLGGLLGSALGALVATIGIAASNAYSVASIYQGPRISYAQPWPLTALLVAVVPLLLAGAVRVCTRPLRHVDARRLTDGWT